MMKAPDKAITTSLLLMVASLVLIRGYAYENMWFGHGVTAVIGVSSAFHGIYVGVL
jgi:hypothetical protein